MSGKLLAVLLLFAAIKSTGQTTPVWSTDIAPILYNNCATCHHNGAIAPFELLSYNDAVVQAAGINADVQSGTMPPWPPDPAYHHMAHERLVSAADKAKIAAWVAGGTPQGNPALAPPVPTFSNAGDLPGTADLTVRAPTFTSTASTGDVYRCFVLSSGQSADRYITSFEAIPGNRQIVHHVLVYADTTGISTTLDAQDPGPGYTSFGGIGTDNAILLGAWVPGSSPLKLPLGFGIKLPKNAKIVVQIHYPAGTAGGVDSTRVRFFFSPSSAIRNVTIAPVLNHFTNITPALSIPANTVKTFTEHQPVPPIDISVLGVSPHMHLLGQNIKAFSVTPAGDTQKLISIPEWEFHWQGFYLFRNIMKVPGGSNLYAQAMYDNTVNNPENPSSPPKNVVAGESTTDEMMLVYFVFTPYLAGDESVTMEDSTTSVGVQNSPMPYYNGNQLLQPYPVPADNEVIAKAYFTQAGSASMDITDATGRLVKHVFPETKMTEGYHIFPIAVGGLGAGNYFLRMNTDKGAQVQKIIVAH